MLLFLFFIEPPYTRVYGTIFLNVGFVDFVDSTPFLFAEIFPFANAGYIVKKTIQYLGKKDE